MLPLNLSKSILFFFSFYAVLYDIHTEYLRYCIFIQISFCSPPPPPTHHHYHPPNDCSKVRQSGYKIIIENQNDLFCNDSLRGSEVCFRGPNSFKEKDVKYSKRKRPWQTNGTIFFRYFLLVIWLLNALVGGDIKYSFSGYFLFPIIIVQIFVVLVNNFSKYSLFPIFIFTNIHFSQYIVPNILFFKYFFGGFFSFCAVQYSALLHLPPLRIHCADGCCDWTQDRCNWCIGSQTL